MYDNTLKVPIPGDNGRITWRQKPTFYDICVPPVEKSYYEMTKKQARAYFEWYIDIIPKRIEYLTETAAERLKCNTSVFDLSPASLIPLWRWFLCIAETEPSSTSPCSSYLTLQTEYILRDIGMYLGQVFIHNEPSIYWILEEHRNIFLNQPVLKGFYPNLKIQPGFEPIHMSRMRAVRFLKNTADEKDLYGTYKKWENLIRVAEGKSDPAVTPIQKITENNPYKNRCKKGKSNNTAPERMELFRDSRIDVLKARVFTNDRQSNLLWEVRADDEVYELTFFNVPLDADAEKIVTAVPFTINDLNIICLAHKRGNDCSKYQVFDDSDSRLFFLCEYFSLRKNSEYIMTMKTGDDSKPLKK